MGFDGKYLGGAADGHCGVRLVPVRGHADMARRGVHHVRFLPRVIQPRAGYRERHDQPVPAALATRKEHQEMQGISGRIQRRVPRIRDARDTRKDAMTKPRCKEVVPNAKHPARNRLSTFSRSAPGTRTHATSSPAARRPCRRSRACGTNWTTRSPTRPRSPRRSRGFRPTWSARGLTAANLRAAMRATLAAYAEGEQDPLWYLRDELNAPQASSAASRRPA